MAHLHKVRPDDVTNIEKKNHESVSVHGSKIGHILMTFLLLFYSRQINMGRLNKRIQAAKRASQSAVSITVKPKKSTSTPLVLDKPTLKSIKKHASFKVITKKDKQNIKKKHLQQKLSGMERAKKESKEAARRKRKAIIGDLKPIQDTLRDILNEDSSGGIGKTSVKVTSSRKGEKQTIRGHAGKQKKLQAQMQKDLSIFQQVLAHPEYDKDPFNTITTHIENKMLLEAMNKNE